MVDLPDPPTIPQRAALEPDSLSLEGTEERYRKTGSLGAGAMGEVGLCEDRRIGREVALKVARGMHRDASLRARDSSTRHASKRSSSIPRSSRSTTSVATKPAIPTSP